MAVIAGVGLLLSRPFAGADVVGAGGEEPVVTVEVAGTVLVFTVGGLVEPSTIMTPTDLARWQRASTSAANTVRDCVP